MFLLFLCLNKDKKRKTFLVFTDNSHKRSKTNKNALKRGSESAQLEKNNFSTEKIYFSNREIKFSQLAVSDFTVGFTSNCFFVKFFCVEVIPYLRHGGCCMFAIVPTIGMAGYQCLMPVASFICLEFLGYFD